MDWVCDGEVVVCEMCVVFYVVVVLDLGLL